MKKFLFFIFLFLYLFINLYLCLGDTEILDSMGILGLDNQYFTFSKVCTFETSTRLFTHPFLLISLKPFFLMFEAFTYSKTASLLIGQAVITSFNVILVYAILELFTARKFTPLLISIIYGVAFSTIIFSAVTESYIFSAFFNLCLIYYTCYLYSKNKIIDLKKDFVIASLMFFSFGVNIINIVVSSIWIIFLFSLCSDKLIIKIKNLFFIFTILLSLIISFTVIEKYFYNINPKSFIESVSDNDIWKVNLSAVTKYNFSSNAVDSVKGIYIQSLYSTGVTVKDSDIIGIYKKRVAFADNDNIVPFLPFIALLVYAFIVFVAEYKNIDKKPLIFILLILCLINIIEYMYFYSYECFLYSQNALPVFIILIGLIFINLKKEWINGILIPFIIYQCTVNTYPLIKIKEIIGLKIVSSKIVLTYIMYSLVTTLCLFILTLFLKKIIKKNISVYFLVVFYFVIIIFTMIFLSMYHTYD